MAESVDPVLLQRTRCTFSAVQLLSLTAFLLFCSCDDFYAAFQHKLMWFCHINNPDAKAMTRLLLTFPSQMQAASLTSIDPGVALHLYQKIKDLPGT